MTKTANQYLKPVLDWLEAGAPHTKHKLTFNMETFASPQADCGTACCIAGATAQFNGLKTEGDNAADQCFEIGDMIGLTREQSNQLFFASDDRNYYLEDIPVEIAAETLRHFLKTGEIVWPEELP